VLFDKLSHASIQDGLRMATASGAKCIPFGHNDMNHLEQLLKENRQSHSGCLLVTEGVFSMDGDIANLGPFVELAHRFNARTYLDVAHDFGVIGTHGLGAAELHGVLNDIDIIMGTFSKIGGGIGGFCVGSEGTIEYLRWMARSFMFSVSIPPSTAAAMHQAIQIFRNEPHLLAKLQENIAYFVGELIKIGVPFSQDHQSSICPVIIGDEEKLSQMTAFLMQNGIYVTPIVFPAVSKEQSRFRFTISAAHSRTDLDYAVLVLKLAIKEFGLNFTAPNNQLRLVG
jgi:glycine C-acetyltransferase